MFKYKKDDEMPTLICNESTDAASDPGGHYKFLSQNFRCQKTQDFPTSITIFMQYNQDIFQYLNMAGDFGARRKDFAKKVEKVKLKFLMYSF